MCEFIRSIPLLASPWFGILLTRAIFKLAHGLLCIGMYFSRACEKETLNSLSFGRKGNNGSTGVVWREDNVESLSGVYVTISSRSFLRARA